MVREAELQEFFAYLQQKEKISMSTKGAYIGDVRNFLAFLAERDIDDVSRTSQTDIRAYLQEMERHGRTNSTRQRHLASIRAYFNFLWQQRAIADNPASRISIRKTKKREPHILHVDEIARLLDIPNPTTRSGQRDQAMLELLYASGMRVSELVGLDVTAVNFSLGAVTCRGMNGMERLIPLGQTALNALRTYVSKTRLELLQDPEEPALFVNTRGQRLTRQGCWKIIKNCAQACALGPNITPNTLRNAFAAHMLANGAELRVVQELMGHADLATTQAYVGPARGRIKDTYNKSHPRA